MFAQRSVLASLLGLTLFLPPLSSGVAAELAPVLPNDNRRAAGTAAGNTLSLNLRAEEGLWRPEGDAGPALRIEAFGEDGDAPTS